MPRRKPTADPANADPAVTVMVPDGPNEPEAAITPDPADQGQAAQAESPSTPDTGIDGQTPQRLWRRHFETLAVTEAGIYAGEDRKFAQVYIAFDKARPTDVQKTKMTDAGFRYRSTEKRWDAPANPVTRVVAKQLVAEFTGVTLGAAQTR